MREADYTRQFLNAKALDRTAHRVGRLLSGNKQEFFPNVTTPDQVLYTLLEAFKARQFAESYRGFSVSACAQVRSRDGMQDILKHGANYKNGPGNSSVDIHAEQMVLDTLRPDDQLSVLIVVGRPQEDHGSGRNSPTLHPCQKCRNRLAESPQITENTVIVCATPDGKHIQWGLLRDYVAFHNGEANNLGCAQFESTPPVLQPLPATPVIDLADPKLDIPTVEWDQRVTLPLIAWMHEEINWQLARET